MATSVDPRASGEDLEADVFSRYCMSRGALQHITGRWGSLAVVALFVNDAPMRFGDLRRRIDGISDRMLSQTLVQLERDGLLVRTVHSTIPPHVDYELTPLGVRIAGPLAELVERIQDELPQVMAAQSAYDAKEGDSPARR